MEVSGDGTVCKNPLRKPMEESARILPIHRKICRLWSGRSSAIQVAPLWFIDKVLIYTSCAGNLEQPMGVRNRVGIGLSYRPARLHRLAESIS